MSDLTSNEIDELLDLLRAQPEDGSGPPTCSELAERAKVTPETMRVRLKRAIQAGKAECIKTRRKGIDGRVQPVPGYKVAS